MTAKKYFLYAFYSIALIAFNSFMSGMEGDKHLTLVLKNPNKALSNGRILATYFANKIPEIFQTSNGIPKNISANWRITVKACEAKYPFFLLDECPYGGAEDSCLLSRKNIPAFRGFFENVICTALSQKITDNSNKIINYVGFGSGKCFSDFRTIVKALHQHPQAKLNIHLIDQVFTPYTGPKDRVNTCETTNNDFSNPNNDFDTFVTQCTALLLSKQPNTSKDYNSFVFQTAYSFLAPFLLHESRFKQFLQGLSNNFPQAQLRLFIHSGYDTYLKNIATYNLGHADVIAASDILDGETEVHNHYKKLCVETFKYNKSLYNSLLTADKDKNIFLRFIGSASDLLALQANSFSSEELCSDLTAIKAYQKICEGISNSEDIIDELTQTQTS